MPAPTEAIRYVRQSHREPHGAVGGDDLEDDVEDGVVDRVALEGGRLNDGDEEDGEDDPPKVVRELTTELLADEVAVGFRCGGFGVCCRIDGHATFDAGDEGVFLR